MFVPGVNERQLELGPEAAVREIAVRTLG